ncbi:MAG: insulinase family protein [Acidobacteriota bacterium]
MARWFARVCLIILGSGLLQGLPGILHGQGRRAGQAPFFQALKSYDESGSLVKAVFRKGVTVLIEEHAQDDLVVVATHFRVGRLSASPELCEIAAETARRALAKGVHDVGGLVEVQVGDQLTSAQAIVPSLNLRDAVRAQLGLFRLQEEQWELDRAWVEEGRKADRSRVQADWGELAAMASGEAPAAPAGETLAPTPESLTRFLAEFYTPENSVLTAVGTVRREQALAILAEELSDFRPPQPAPAEAAKGDGQAASPGKSAAAEEPARPGPADGGGLLYRQERRELSQARVLVGFRVPAEGEPGGLAVDLIRYLLAEGHASLLELPREDEAMAPAFVRSGFRPLLDGRLLVFDLEPTDTLEKAEVRVLAALGALSDREPPTRLLNRAKALMIADWYAGLEALDSRSVSLARAEFAGGYKSRDRFPSRVSGVTPGDIRQAVQAYCAYSKGVLLELLPTGFEPRNFTPESFRETLDILVPAGVEQQAAFLGSIDSLGKVRTFALSEFKPQFADLPPRRSSVLRGPEIYLREDHRQPLVHVAFYFTGGRISESGEQEGLTRLLGAALLENLRRAAGGAELLALESSGARLSMATEEDFFGIQATVLASGFEDMFLGLIGWLHGGITLSENDVKAATAGLATGHGPACRDGADPLVRRGLREFFDDHPYSHVCGERPSGHFSTEQVEAWRKQLVDQIHPTIVVSGAISGTAFLEGLVSRLSNPRYAEGKLPGTRVTYPEKVPVRESEGRRAVLLFPAPRAGSVEVPVLGVAVQLLNGPAGRLTLQLRQNGVGYRGMLAFESLVRGGALWLVVDSAEGKLAEAEKLVLDETRKLSDRSVVPFDFRAAQVAAITAWLLRQRDPDSFLYDTMEAALAQEPADYGNRYILNVRSLRMGEVEQALQRYTGEVE